MKIGFYAPMKSPHHPIPSGDRLMARHLMKMFRLKGYNVQLVSQLRSFEGKGEADQQRRIKKTAQHIVQKWQQRYPESPFDFWITYHLYHKAPDWLGPVLSQFWNIPYGVIEASYAEKQTDGPWAEGLKISKQAIEQADYVWSFSEFDMEALIPILKPAAKHQKIVPFIDERLLEPIRQKRSLIRQEIRQKIGLHQDDFLWISVGMMRPGAKFESYQILAKSLSLIQKNRINLLIVGGGAMEAQVHQLFHGLTNHRIIFVGVQSQDKVLEMMAAANAMIWPAISEAYGMVLLEAHFMGLPVVAGRFGGVSEIVVDQKTGFLIPADASFRDGAGLAQAMMRLEKNDDLYQYMSCHAQQKAYQQHSMNAVARTMELDILT